MFKIIALITLLSGQPVDVLVSNAAHPNCPNVEALANIGNDLQAKIDQQIGEHKFRISDIKCVPADDVMSEAKKMIAQKGA